MAFALKQCAKYFITLAADEYSQFIEIVNPTKD